MLCQVILFRIPPVGHGNFFIGFHFQSALHYSPITLGVRQKKKKQWLQPCRAKNNNNGCYASTVVNVFSQAQLRAASALRGLSVNEDLRNEIVTRGGLVPLLRLSSSDDVEIQMEVQS